MDKKIGRLLWPSVGLYFFLLVGFIVATVAVQQYLLAVVELVIFALVLVLYFAHRKYRRRQLKIFLYSHTIQL